MYYNTNNFLFIYSDVTWKINNDNNVHDIKCCENNDIHCVEVEGFRTMRDLKDKKGSSTSKWKIKKEDLRLSMD